MLADILIRPARPADVPDMIALFTLSRRNGLVAASEDVVVGSLSVQVHHSVGLAGHDGRPPPPQAGHRRSAVGCRMKACAGHVSAACTRWTFLQVWPHNAAAIALYRSRGFTVEGRLGHHRRANGQLWDAVTMGLVLDTHSPGSPYPDAENL